MFNKAAVLNTTNAIPKRVLQISIELSRVLPIEFICWKRFSKGNIQHAVFIDSSNIFEFMCKSYNMLMRMKYKILLFDDMRLLPLCVVIKVLTKAKVIYNRQEVPSVEVATILSHQLRLPKFIAKKISEYIEDTFGKAADAVFTIPLKYDELERLRGWGKPLETIWNVPELSTIRKLKNESDQRNYKKLIYSGNVALENGFLSYLKLVKILNKKIEVKLILIGRHWKMTLKEINDFIRKEECEDIVQYRPWVPYDELLPLLSESNIGLAFTDPKYEKYIYMDEGASRKVFTYMAVGLPVIAGGSFGRIVEEERAGYFIEYNNLKGMISAAEKILLDSELAKEMGRCGQQAVTNKYNWEIERNKINKILNKVF